MKNRRKKNDNNVKLVLLVKNISSQLMSVTNSLLELKVKKDSPKYSKLQINKEETALHLKLIEIVDIFKNAYKIYENHYENLEAEPIEMFEKLAKGLSDFTKSYFGVSKL